MALKDIITNLISKLSFIKENNLFIYLFQNDKSRNHRPRMGVSNNRKQSKNESLESRLEFKLKLLKSGYDLFYEFFKLDCEATAKNLSSLINLNDQEEKQLIIDLV